MDLTEAVREIRDDNLSGSQAMTRRAAALVRDWLAEAPSGGGRLETGLLELGAEIIRAHPDMAPLYNLFQALLRCLDDVPAGDAAPSRIRRAAANFVDGMELHNHAIARGLRDVIGTEPRIFTHSAGSTVRAALVGCREAGVPLTVHCTESRPAGEGSALARELAAHGVPTTLSTDSLAFSLLRQAGHAVLVVGADAVTPGGVVNKAGTLGLATAARSWGIPCYVLAGSEKFLPAAGPGTRQREKPPDEILTEAPEGLRVINRYFDTTPLDCVTAVITEEGALTPEETARKLADVSIHPGLLARIRQG